MQILRKFFGQNLKIINLIDEKKCKKWHLKLIFTLFFVFKKCVVIN